MAFGTARKNTVAQNGTTVTWTKCDGTGGQYTLTGTLLISDAGNCPAPNAGILAVHLTDQPLKGVGSAVVGLNYTLTDDALNYTDEDSNPQSLDLTGIDELEIEFDVDRYRVYYTPPA